MNLIRFFLTLAYLLTGTVPVLSQVDVNKRGKRPPTAAEIIQANEYMKFKVKYSFFKIAWFEMEAIGDTVVHGDSLFHIRSTIWTNSSIPFIGTEIDEYNSIFHLNEDSLPVTDNYWKHDIDEGDYREYDYFYDRDRNQVRYRENATRDTLELVDPATSGHLILLWARMYAGTDESYEMNVYTAKERGRIVGKNSTRIEERKVSAFDNDKFDTFYSSARADVAGPFGFSGDFEVWFLDDPLRIPVEIRLNVFVGNVKILLEEYRRGDKNRK